MKRTTLCAFGARYSHSSMALYCLKQAVPFELFIKEFSINDRLDHCIEKLTEDAPNVIGFSCYIWSIKTVLKATSSIKKILPDCFILLGGPEVSCGGEELLKKYSFIDMVIRGEGEAAFAHFLKNYYEGKSILDTPSACIRCGEDIITTADAPLVDLNSLPFIYNDLSAFENKTIYYETSRGCPFRCAYCMSAGAHTRFLDLKRVQKELNFFLQSNVKRVKLVDRTFNYPAQRAYEIFSMLISLSEKYPESETNFHFEISACLLTDEILSLLQKARPGLIQLEIGVQSTNIETLKAINRSHDLTALLENTKKLCLMKNIHVHTDLIAGLPLETYSSFAKSFDDVYSLGAQKLQLGFLKVLQGSPLYDIASEFGIEYTDYPPYEVLKTNDVSFDELRRLHDTADILDALHNSGRFSKTLAHIIKGSPFGFFESFSAYAKKQGYFDAPQPLHRMFELILEFSGFDAKTGEALIYDWLMTGKPKKWPKGLVPKVPDKQKLRQCYAQGEGLLHYSSLSAADSMKRCFICDFYYLFEQKTTLIFDYCENSSITVSPIIL